MDKCPSCSAELPDSAKFCANCGAPRTAPAAAEPAAPSWETCEIVAATAGEKWSPVFPSDYIRFKAQADGPQGEYTVGESDRIKAGLADYYQANKQNKNHVKAVEALAAALTGGGWERAGKGQAWFSLRFRRPLA
jgi:hypothetical protein